MYNPYDWYWLADDGRVYSSARDKNVLATDDAFLARKAIGNYTNWPRDDAGNQTDAALKAVLAPYGIGPKTRFTFNEFLDLFTVDEQTELMGAAIVSIPFKAFYDRAVGSEYLDLSDPRVTSGFAFMVSEGLLTQARSDRILKGLPPEA